MSKKNTLDSGEYSLEWVNNVTKENLEGKDTKRLLNIQNKIRTMHPLHSSSWYCDGCPGPKSDKCYCKATERALCNRLKGLRTRIKSILDTREHVV